MLTLSKRVVLIFLLSLLMSACSTTSYETHYGLFTAENSAGEFRQFRVYWQTAEIDGWGKDEVKALPVVLEAQCSDRQVLFYDESFGDGRRCKDAPDGAINFCGRKRVDTDRRGRPVENNKLCATITDRNGATNILDLEGEVLINMHCRPKRTEKPGIEKPINVDYLLSSQIPYIVSTKKVKGGDVETLVPPLFNHSSVCENN